MKDLKCLLVAFMAANCLSMIFLSMVHLNHEDTNRRILQEPESEIPNTYSFDDPTTAYQILEQLDLYEKPGYTTRNEQLAHLNYYNYHYGLTKNDQYCQEHRAYFV